MACVGTLRTFGAPAPLTLGVRPHGPLYRTHPRHWNRFSRCLLARSQKAAASKAGPNFVVLLSLRQGPWPHAINLAAGCRRIVCTH